MLEATIKLLQENGEDVDSWVVRNRDYVVGFRGRVLAFFSGIYSISMRREMQRRLAVARPDIVHAHNLYPLMSTSVLDACNEVGVPVVVHCHSHFLTCPIGTHLRDGSLCEKCTSGSTLHCVAYNCRNNIPQSIAYALRTSIARFFGWFRQNATRLIVLSNFAKRRLVELGFPSKQLMLLPNVVNVPTHEMLDGSHLAGSYVVYVGRLSHEKGLSVLIRAAQLLPDIEFRIAGDGPERRGLERLAPSNVIFLGWLDKAQLSEIYSSARLAVVPSVCYETFGLAAADAMSHGLPVVASRLGGLVEVVDENQTGLCFRAGDHEDLAIQIRELWQDEQKCKDMGRAAFLKASTEYSSRTYYLRLMNIYNSAIKEG